MLVLTTRIQRSALQPKSQKFFCSLVQSRSLSKLIEQEPYWQKIKPWENVTAEEFKSYRWQVS